MNIEKYTLFLKEDGIEIFKNKKLQDNKLILGCVIPEMAAFMEVNKVINIECTCVL